MRYRQLSIQIVLYSAYVWNELHKLLIVEFSPFVHEVSSVAYCQKEHLGISGHLCGKCYGYL